MLLFIGLGVNSFGQDATGGASSSSPADEMDFFGLGVGYGGGLGGPGVSYSLLPNYSGTTSLGIMATYEHKFAKQFGIGASFSYASGSYTGNNIPYSIIDPFGNPVASGNLTNKINASYIGLAARPLYHFKGSKSFDPYAGILFGFTFTSMSSTTTSAQGTYSSSEFYPGILVGAVVGGRFAVSKKILIWLELSYSGMPDYLANIGVAYKLSKF
ncbi:MAG TPA: hypothetical protein VK890_01380 [Bacteroidia bacterium]|nr:hypothetical protein [Bacteroidia bacterium]